MSEKLAFEIEYKGFIAKAYWGDGADARIEVMHPDGQRIMKFFYPAYKIFNIQAHWNDIVEGELQNSDVGWRMAGSDLLGGCVMPSPAVERPAPNKETK